ncbi:Protein kinase protein with adenine nucleotide alpha hydrolases-like domain [Striga hermonthica]|uniref:Protein kinase protein with adenine nucleotide alpha hydrolases-like domain n=1 Tax=Striga hermonthica TaxID=68872 RepID=A0A9N7MKH7_STRHE|nr:Protein kinase protein with adenine nucleotide alpha hydrolases-like domain [Striga hermonthica]
MRRTAGVSEVAECGGGESTMAACSVGGGRGSLVVVGVRLDARSRELLTWALVKVAHSGDRVVALHILDPSTEDKSSLLSLVKNFDSLLAAYEGFCSLKQVDLELKVCKGTPARQILVREAKSCGAQSLILGTSNVHHKIRSRIAVAKYCASNLDNNISVLCVDNGKIVFRRETNASYEPYSRSHGESESLLKWRKTLGRSPLSLPTLRVLSLPSNKDENSSVALVPFKKQLLPVSKSRWESFRRVLSPRRGTPETSSTKKSFLMTWKLKLPGQQSFAAIYPDQKQIAAPNEDKSLLSLDSEKGAIVPYSSQRDSVPCVNKISSEELKALAEKYSTTCQRFSYQELSLATNNFLPENLIGKGGSSQVFLGCLPGGKKLAVKILKPSEDVLEHFVSEIEIITSLQHKNIISLVGFCFEENKLLLVYDLLSRGSLEENLNGAKKSNQFGLEERYKVALGVAEALDYLHSLPEPVIHRDVKSSNILLSDAYEPQLSDFGLATRVSSCSHHVDTSDVAGTFGYLAPEYLMHGKLNEKLDVYAFGVVLLELLSGRKPICSGSPKGQESLVMWAKHILEDGELSELRDPQLVNSCKDEQFEIMALAAALCIRYASQSRPDISLVLKLLQRDQEAVNWARQEIRGSDELNGVHGEESTTKVQYFLNLALLDLEDDSASVSSTEQNISVEDYLRGRWSHSSSFN